MDYAACAKVSRHASFAAFQDFRRASAGNGRVVLFTTKGAQPYTRFAFRSDDLLMMGRESAGVPQEVHDYADARLYVPMQAGARSINVINTAAMALGEALRQTDGFAAVDEV